MTGSAARPLAGTRIVVISSEQPGRRMAGPAIRALNLARELLTVGALVTLALPQRPDTDLGVPVTTFGRPSAPIMRRFAAGADVVLTQPQRVDVALGLHSAAARIIYDLYVPAYVEYPASLMAEGLPPRTRARLVERNQREYATAIECGDAFVVASERQKDFVLGALGQAGRLRSPPSPHAEAHPRIAVVPFGLPAAPPHRSSSPPIRGRLVPPDSVVALWAGGVWNWFDPVTVVRGLAAARLQNPRLRLVFLGAGHPSSAFQGQSAAADALASPEVARAVEDGSVVFAADWVPYEQRGGYLGDADMAVCAHYDSPEARMSFRTRFLDHMWAGLPTITTEGGVLSERMCADGTALCVPAQDAAAWSAALLELGGDVELRHAMGRRSRRLADHYRWSEVVRPLAAVIDDIRRGEVGPRRRPGVATTAAYLAVAIENRLR